MTRSTARPANNDAICPRARQSTPITLSPTGAVGLDERGRRIVAAWGMTAARRRGIIWQPQSIEARAEVWRATTVDGGGNNRLALERQHRYQRPHHIDAIRTHHRRDGGANVKLGELLGVAPGPSIVIIGRQAATDRRVRGKRRD